MMPVLVWLLAPSRLKGAHDGIDILRHIKDVKAYQDIPRHIKWSRIVESRGIHIRGLQGLRLVVRVFEAKRIGQVGTNLQCKIKRGETIPNFFPLYEKTASGDSHSLTENESL